MEYALDRGAGDGLRLGLMLLSTDETLEFEARDMLAGRAVNLLHTRIPAHAHVTPATLRQMEVGMPASAALLPEGLCAVGYACTSGATVIGPGRVADLVHEAHPGVPVTDPLSATVTALHALGASRIALVTPYVPEISAPIRARLEEAGIATLHEISFGQSEDRTVARITEATTRAAMLKAAGAPGVQAVFASCTNLRSFGVLGSVEAELGLPVVTSNQALLWHMLHLAGVATAGWGPGRLFGL